jgi:hypothetical protein
VVVTTFFSILNSQTWFSGVHDFVFIVLTRFYIKHNSPDIIILNKQQKQAYLLDIAVPNSHNITQKLIKLFRALRYYEKSLMLGKIGFYHLQFQQRNSTPSLLKI